MNRLQKAGCLTPGWSGIWQWSVDGERVAWIRLKAETDSLRLIYRVRRPGCDWDDVSETVRVVRAACTLGGSRPYFICPGIVNGRACARRVAKLHGHDRYFLCRQCYGLGHASQGETARDRTLRRANRIRQRLGGDPGLAAPFPKRPKGMWRRTYQRLRERAFEAEIAAEDAFSDHVEQLMRRIDTSNRNRRSRR
ncbi:MAG: hypothetical protein WCO67_25555 [Betaproteobacteria bacterium]